MTPKKIVAIYNSDNRLVDDFSVVIGPKGICVTLVLYLKQRTLWEKVESCFKGLFGICHYRYILTYTGENP